jgi:hypothetical protein
LVRLGAVLVILLCAVDASAQTHWAFRPRVRPAVPEFNDPAARVWLRTGVDAFVLHRLRAEGLQPAPEAERRTLIRRLSFDLTGLPPAPDEVEAFVRDPAPSAYERLVDRLLSSPHYGERWAQHWLDVVRYSESDGFEYDRYRPGMWRYRDYVIKSFNDDKPFARFVTEQIAGDVLGSDDPEVHVAAGFHRMGPVRRNAGNADVAFSRNEVLTEMTDGVGLVFLGLTVGCARCHDHKFDAFPQEDYYRLQAYLGATQEHSRVLADAATQADWQRRAAPIEQEIKRLKTELGKAAPDARKRLEQELKEAQLRLPEPLPAVCTVHEAEPTAIHVLKRGVAERKGKRVEPGFPSALPAPSSAAGEGNPRLSLARWLADPEHPLTIRVFVNRIWHYHFGRGLVETPNDFGVNGARPSHPELLDYLAYEFVRGGGELKPLQRLIVTSSTYRQASRNPAPAAGQERDPQDRLLWQFPRRRLSAEEIRDAMLSASGRRNDRAGGPSVVVPAEKDLVDLLYDPSQWQVTPDEREQQRRSIYLLAKRNLRLPFGQAFDQPDLQTSCARREASTHALQALELLNGKTSNALAAAFAERLRREAGPHAACRVALAYRLTTGRPPSTAERELALRFLAEQPLREFALALFNVNAFLYVD